jgi:hypothetical protein
VPFGGDFGVADAAGVAAIALDSEVVGVRGVDSSAGGGIKRCDFCKQCLRIGNCIILGRSSKGWLTSWVVGSWLILGLGFPRWRAHPDSYAGACSFAALVGLLGHGASAAMVILACAAYPMAEHWARLHECASTAPCGGAVAAKRSPTPKTAGEPIVHLLGHAPDAWNAPGGHSAIVPQGCAPNSNGTW